MLPADWATSVAQHQPEASAEGAAALMLLADRNASVAQHQPELSAEGVGCDWPGFCGFGMDIDIVLFSLSIWLVC
jgi:hypothetical protein